MTGVMKNEELIRQKMEHEGLPDAAIRALMHGVKELMSERKMTIDEEELCPVPQLPNWEDLVTTTAEADSSLLDQMVIIKLNGGLGTSMGLQRAKSLLSIKPGINFLDLIVRQVSSLRKRSGCRVQLLLMNSFSTSADTLNYLKNYADEGFDRAEEVELMQNKVPKLLRDSLAPVSLPGHEELEWCPPGHGDLYAALSGSGRLEQLLQRGVKYAFISNSDNLGALPDTRFLRWFAESGAPFVMEVTQRTEADKKGGHLAMRRADHQLILREVAQCSPEDLPHFQDISRHRFFNTNNLWIRLDILRDFMLSHDGVVPLPIICNAKTADPRDPQSAPVYQLETAMGAAIQCFPSSQAVNVSRERFFPVKTSSDLLLLRSDAVEIGDNGGIRLAAECHGIPPIIQLEHPSYKMADSLAALGLPSLKRVTRLRVRIPWHFEPGYPLTGDVDIH